MFGSNLSSDTTGPISTPDILPCSVYISKGRPLSPSAKQHGQEAKGTHSDSQTISAEETKPSCYDNLAYSCVYRQLVISFSFKYLVK